MEITWHFVVLIDWTYYMCAVSTDGTTAHTITATTKVVDAICNVDYILLSTT